MQSEVPYRLLVISKSSFEDNMLDDIELNQSSISFHFETRDQFSPDDMMKMSQKFRNYVLKAMNTDDEEQLHNVRTYYRVEPFVKVDKSYMESCCNRVCHKINTVLIAFCDYVGWQHDGGWNKVA